MKTRCLRCPRLVSRGSHCPIHEAEAKRELNDPTYKANRLKVLERDGNACVRCGSTVDLIADHIIERRSTFYGMHAVERMQTLCRACHNRKTAGG